MRKNSNKQGFTLVEIIVSFSVMMLVIVACTNLLVTIIRSNTDNEDRLVAYGLAQEGLEAVRNMRDSDWLLGADFQGQIGTDCAWNGGCLPGVDGRAHDYVIDSVLFDTPPADPTIQSSQLSGVSPWHIEEVSLPAQADETVLHLVPSATNTKEVWYRPCFTACTDPQSPFSRYIEVQALGVGSGTTAEKYFVSSVVTWNMGQKTVRLTTELTDWKGGPL